MSLVDNPLSANQLDSGLFMKRASANGPENVSSIPYGLAHIEPSSRMGKSRHVPSGGDIFQSFSGTLVRMCAVFNVQDAGIVEFSTHMFLLALEKRYSTEEF